jgi:hypothetical protein
MMIFGPLSVSRKGIAPIRAKSTHKPARHLKYLSVQLQSLPYQGTASTDVINPYDNSTRESGRCPSI